jgi:PTS system nitrogen regulatory IIA component
VALCFLEHPIDFGAIDAKPVEILFIVTSPTVRSHLHLLSRLAYILRRSGVQQALLAQPARDAVFALFEAAEATLSPPAESSQ